MTPLQKLIEHGQSFWIDNLSRGMIRGGELARRVAEEGLRGVTSNPAIFQKAIAGSRDYDGLIEEAVSAKKSVEEIYERLVTSDVREACDILRPVFDASGGEDGFVSLEVSPRLAQDTEGSIREARHLHKIVDRPNLFIKIPGTPAGIPAIEELLFDGIHVNITLLFSVDRYEAVAQAYMRALERRLEAGRPVKGIASVASFFLSRIDTLVDQLLGHRIHPGAAGRSDPDPRSLLGRAGVANAKLAYQSFKKILQSDRWKALEKKGARPQRMLWASTSTKNPAYKDVMYVEPLIGPHTVNTMPEETIAAFSDHGKVKTTVEDGMAEAGQVPRDLEKLGISLHVATEQLQNDGVQKFIDPYESLLATLAAKRQTVLNRLEGKDLQRMAQKLRRMSIRMTTEAGSGHPTSCMSCAEIMSVLFFRELRWDPGDPKARNVDSFILSKGHAVPIFWAALSEAGAISEDPMTLRRLDSTLEGHPTPNNPWVRVATGSLGQGLSAAVGIALANRLDGLDARVYCLLGDGESSEGSIWEAAQMASLNRLKNLIAIVDMNGLAQSGPAPYRHDTSVFARRFSAFGWKTHEIDGHDIGAVIGALEAAHKEGPTAIIARTEKGKGVSFLEGREGWHGKPVPKDKLDAALKEVGEEHIKIRVAPRRVGSLKPSGSKKSARIAVEYEKGLEVATRNAYGAALKKLGAVNPRIVALDGDVKNSTFAEVFAQAFPDRYIEGFIAEQNMVGAALGLATAGFIPYVSSFACFLPRAADFIRMAAHSRPAHLVLCGSHAGVSIGEDGTSQMGLEDLALFRALYGSTVFYPSDAVSAERLTEAAAQTNGLVYIRTSRPKTPVLYSGTEEFPAGGSKILKTSKNDRLTVVGGGVTLHEALAAHEALQKKGVSIRVIDAYSVKPIDRDTLEQAARETGGILVVEDHWAEGGLGEAVAAAVGSIAPFHHLAVRRAPRSGKPEELLDYCGISRKAIEEKVLEVVGGKI